MAVLTNTMLQGSSADTEVAEYSIEKSLRFNSSGKSPTLDRVYGTGNRRKWTFSFWVKRGKLGLDVNNAEYVIYSTSANNTAGNAIFQFHNDDAFNVFVGYIGAKNLKTNRKFRDNTNWYHFVVTFCAGHTLNEERMNIYVNGVRETSFASDDRSGMTDTDWGINKNGNHRIGNNGNKNRSFDGMLSNVHFIDGLVVGPSAFGEFDSTGVWKPKTFALPAVNTGATWSSMMTSETGSWYSSSNVNLFNGILGQGSAGQTASASSEDKWIKFTPTGGIEFKQGIRVQHWPGGNSPYIQARYTLKLTDGRDFIVENQQDSNDWITLYEGSGTIEYIQQVCSNNQFNNWGAIEVDGVLLEDGRTNDTSILNNPNNGTTWSSNGTVSGNSTSGGKEFTRLFNGNVGEYAEQSGNDVTLTWTPSPAISVKKTMRIYFLVGGNPNDTVVNGDATAINVDPANGWVDVDVPSGGMSFSKLEIKRGGSGVYARASAIEIDGHMLLDGAVDNSFHLEFNDKDNIGKDTLGKKGKLADATGGLPFYNTTGTYGEVKGSGYRTDSSAGTTDGTGLIFALPGDVLTDEHDHVNTGSSAKTLSNVGSVAVSSDQSRFYGSSLAFNGVANQRLWMDATNAGTDFDMGTGSYTVEAWVYLNEMPTANGYDGAMWIIGWGPANQNDGFDFAIGSTNLLFDADDFASCDINVAHNMGIKQWYHVAVSYNGSDDKLRAFINGKKIAEVTSTVTATTASTGVAIGAAEPSGATDGNMNGYINDLRVYKNVCKYTNDFVATDRNDFGASKIAEHGHQTSILTFQDSSFKDNSYQNHLITPVNSATIISATDSPPTGITYALQSDGTNNKYITVPNNGFDLSGDFTIEFWMNRSGGDTDWRALVSPDANKGGFFGFTQTTKIGFGRSGVAWDGMSGADKIDADEWHHCVYVRLGTTLSAYVDGTREIHSTGNANDYSISGSRVAIGGGENNMVATAQWSNFRVTSDAKYDPSLSSLTVPTPPFSLDDQDLFGDASEDTPTKNYPTWNPLHKQTLPTGAQYTTTVTNGNLKCSLRNRVVATSMAIPAGSGKYYFEYTLAGPDGDWWSLGVCPAKSDFNTLSYPMQVGNLTGGVAYEKNGRRKISGSDTNNWGSTFTYGDTIGVALDFSSAGNGKVWFAKNNTWQNSGNPVTGANPAHDSLAGDYIVACNDGGGGAETSGTINFGQRKLKYDPPTDYVKLCSSNLPNIWDGTDYQNDPSKFFDNVLYKGDGVDRALEPFKFQPDFVWFKNRDHTNGQMIVDVIRGVQKVYYAHLPYDEDTESESLTDFYDNGWGMGTFANNNTNGEDYVLWGWDAGTAVASTSNSGSATNYTRWTNATAGFSIVKATISTGSGYHQKTMDHGLGVAPDLIIDKSITSNDNEGWRVYHSAIGTGKVFFLNTTDDQDASAWKVTATSNSSFTFDSYGAGQNNLFYIWAGIPGFSNFGKYSGGGAHKYIYCGFKPRLVLLKCYDTDGESWFFYDSRRGSTAYLSPDTNAVENNNANTIVFNANGFILTGENNDSNASSRSYMWGAWAEHPTKTANPGSIVPTAPT